MNDDLPRLLQTWRHEPALDSDFKAQVQARLDEPAQLTRRSATVISFPWALPLAAGLAVLLSISAGIGAGIAVNRAQTNDLMAAAYARTIDPILMSGHDPTQHQ